MSKRVIVIGGGVAGMQAALSLKRMGCSPLVVEKEARLGGKLNCWDRLFPSQTPAAEVVDDMAARLGREGVRVMTSAEVTDLGHEPDGKIEVGVKGGERLEAEAVVIASGFGIFDATLKQEYGYGLYENVITSADLEQRFKEGDLLTAEGRPPRRIAFLHCVGSRDEQIGQRHCSRVCCITGVKQAIEVRQALPECEVYNFYMDMRMFGSGFEELYKEAQQRWHVNFVRGRISEAGPAGDGQIRIKAEDTLAGRPLRLTVDLLVLLVGKCAGASNRRFSEGLGVDLRPSGFFDTLDAFAFNTSTRAANVFVAGTCIAPKSVGEAINDGSHVAAAVSDYLLNLADRGNR